MLVVERGNMTDSTKENEPFVIGLALAGAISAGAYTAGVLDFLFRALASHNARVGEAGGPKHRVVIKAMSGTSAGGVSPQLPLSSISIQRTSSPKRPSTRGKGISMRSSPYTTSGSKISNSTTPGMVRVYLARAIFWTRPNH